MRTIFFSIMLLIFFYSSDSFSNENKQSNNVNHTRSSKVIENVPFVKQKDNFCGPAAMVSIFKFYGQDITQEEVAKEVYTPKLKGALISDMENFADKMGYNTMTTNGDQNLLVSLIDEGIPPIVLVDRGKWIVTVPHYYVVYGYNKSRNTFILHTGYEGNQEIEFSEFDGQWKKMNRLTLIVRKQG